MKRLFSVLREKRGMTLIEMVVGAGLLCVVIGIFSASMRPAAEVTRRTQELNSAELIADNLLETIRSEVETAVGSIKCYPDIGSVLTSTGDLTGAVIEFRNERDMYVLLGADGCPETTVKAGSGAGSVSEKIDPGFLVERYYKQETDGYYYADADGKAISRGVAKVYTEGFYMGFRAETSFEIASDGSYVTATVTICREKDGTRTALFTDSQVIDLRYKPVLNTTTHTARQKDTADG